MICKCSQTKTRIRWDGCETAQDFPNRLLFYNDVDGVHVCVLVLLLFILLFSPRFYSAFTTSMVCSRVYVCACVCLRPAPPRLSGGWLFGVRTVAVCVCVHVCMCACVHARTHTTINTHDHNICVHIDVHKRISVHIDECVSLVCRWQGAMGRHLSIRDVVRRKSITRRQCRTD